MMPDTLTRHTQDNTHLARLMSNTCTATQPALFYQEEEEKEEEKEEEEKEERERYMRSKKRNTRSRQQI
ncbi:hypothetical protein E2C01_004328 [Portunus trituberculatus]|uniref:Uncharacterized protein n=1 Tax=Portunus trituberculatus TaxID=210409 RepID=A0A5B7CRC9_PORTR|nr:hypothetical protein [Portunus trituberculatus]